MKRIKLQNIDIRSFKGIAQRRVDFAEGDTTTISGDNATGKTTIMDAFLWLLWGVNAQDSQTPNFGIRPCNADGSQRMEENPEVAGTIEVTDDQSGEVTTMTLKRKWTAVWRVKRGEKEKTFAKNQGEYYVNDVPVKESEYRAKVEGLLTLDVFKSVTNPYYFPRLPWQDKRQILLAISGDVTYGDISQQREEFARLLDSLAGTTVEERRKELAAKCAKYTKDIEEKPIQIEEVKRNTPIEPDYAALEREKAEAEAEIADIEALLYDYTAQADRAKAKTEEMVKLMQKQGNAVAKAQEQAYAAAKAANQARNDAEEALAQTKRDRDRAMAKLRYDIEQEKTKIEQDKRRMAKCDADREQLLREFDEADAQAFTKGESLTCPIYHRPCQDAGACAKYAEDWQEARNQFNEGKIRKLDAIEARGQSNNQLKAEAEKALEASQAKLAELQAKVEPDTQRWEEAVAEAQAKLDAMPPLAEAQQIRGEDLPQWRELEEEIKAAREEMNQWTAEKHLNAEAERDKKKSITARLDEVKRKLGNRQIIEAMKSRIKEIEREQETLLEARAKVQQELMVIDEMEKSRMAEVERRVNGHFKYVRFQMSEPTLTTGEEKPCCNCLVDGVKWEDANTASKITAGIDIINALSRHYQACAPIFIDNAECTNQEIEAPGQTILLKVSKEPELTVR